MNGNNKVRSKSRNLSTGEYFEIVQKEYIVAMLRSKIYPSPNDKQYWKRVMDYKKQRIDEIAERNGLKSIFNDEETRKAVNSVMYNEHNVPIFMNDQDKRNYYMSGSEFQYNGELWTLDLHNEKDGTLCLYNKKREQYEVVRVGDANRVL